MFDKPSGMDVDHFADSEAGLPVIDWDVLHQLTEGDEELRQMILKTFMDTTQQYIDELAHCFEGKKVDQWIKVAHKLYGSAVSIGATFLSTTCNEAQNVDPSDHCTINRLHPLINDHYQNVQGTLIKFMA
jgi:HPt (histidine-containing phosphotransfer) domain-containing protein